MTTRERVERLALSVDRCLAIFRGDLTAYRMKLDELSGRVAALEARADPYRVSDLTRDDDGPMTIEAG